MPVIEAFTDRTPMPFGRHKGKALANVPAGYLMYLWNSGPVYGGLKKYIEENKAALEMEVKNSNKHLAR